MPNTQLGKMGLEAMKIDCNDVDGSLMSVDLVTKDQKEDQLTIFGDDKDVFLSRPRSDQPIQSVTEKERNSPQNISKRIPLLLQHEKDVEPKREEVVVAASDMVLQNDVPKLAENSDLVTNRYGISNESDSIYTCDHRYKIHFSSLSRTAHPSHATSDSHTSSDCHIQSSNVNSHSHKEVKDKLFKCDHCLRVISSSTMTRRQHEAACRMKPGNGNISNRMMRCMDCRVMFAQPSDFSTHVCQKKSFGQPGDLENADKEDEVTVMAHISGSQSSKCTGEETDKEDLCTDVSNASKVQVPTANGPGKRTEIATKGRQPFSLQLQRSHFQGASSDLGHRLEREEKYRKLHRKVREGLSTPKPIVKRRLMIGDRKAVVPLTITRTLTNPPEVNGFQNSVVHDSGKKEECLFCKKQFRTTSALKSHINVHEIVRRRNNRLLLCDRRGDEPAELTGREVLTKLRTGTDADSRVGTTDGFGKNSSGMLDLLTVTSPLDANDTLPSVTVALDLRTLTTATSGANRTTEVAADSIPSSNFDSEPTMIISPRSSNYCPPLSSPLNPAPSSDGCLSGVSGQALNEKELILKVRIAGVEDKDFIEVDLDKNNLTFSNLMTVCSQELLLSRDRIVKIRKLPNTSLRRDKDVMRLKPYQELEVVLA